LFLGSHELPVVKNGHISSIARRLLYNIQKFGKFKENKMRMLLYGTITIRHLKHNGCHTEEQKQNAVGNHENYSISPFYSQQ